MSNKLPETSNSEEVDLRQLFSYLERGFKKIGDLIMAIFDLVKWLFWKLSLLILLVLATLKKHFIKIAAAGILTFVAFYILDKKSTPIYQSNLIIKQNYFTGKLLYSNITNFNSLAITGDSIGLGLQLDIPPEQAAKIIGFDVRDYMNQNELLEKYDNYVKGVDSSLRTPFESFKERYDLENYQLQKIVVSSIDISAFNELSDKIILSLEKNEYFKEEKQRERDLILNKIKAQQEIVLKSDTLQAQYLKLLQKYYGAVTDDETQQSTLNINLSNTKDKIETKEYALFEQQNQLKLNLVELQNQLENKEKIVRLQKGFAPPILLESSYSRNRNKATLLVMAFMLFFFVIREFSVFEIIEKYGNKEKLLEK